MCPAPKSKPFGAFLMRILPLAKILRDDSDTLHGQKDMYPGLWKAVGFFYIKAVQSGSMRSASQSSADSTAFSIYNNTNRSVKLNLSDGLFLTCSF